LGGHSPVWQGHGRDVKQTPRYHPKKQRPFLGDPGEAWG
jgi:hypothetical protein